MPRPQHKTAHAPCPNGATNWADCDLAVAHQWGHCKALVDGKPDPHECTRWAVAEAGWCGQHYAGETERILSEARAAKHRADVTARIDAYITIQAACPSLHECPHDGLHPKVLLTPQADSTRGLVAYALAAGGGIEPPTRRVTTGRSTSELPRKGPHRID